jgi:hypothetical protein
MSLDVYLTYEEDGNTITVYDANITHNLGKMADAAGIYEACWRPEEKGWTQAKDIAPILEEGLQRLKDQPEYFQQFNSPNGWGLYEHFVPWIERYLAACKQYPNAAIGVWR